MSQSVGDACSGGGTSSQATTHPQTSHVKRSKVHLAHLATIAGKPKHGAELVDNGRDNKASYVHIETLGGTPNMVCTADSRRILFKNDGPGMDPTRALECLSLGYTDGPDPSRIGMFGGGFQSGTIGLGESALLMTRTEHEITVGMLSLRFLRAMGETELKLPMLEWRRSPHAAMGERPWTIRTSGEEYRQNVPIFALYTAYATEEELLDAVLKHVPTTGTCVECYDLYPGQLLFDPDAPDGDIRLAAGCNTHTNLPADKAPALDTSLRAYLEVLYLPRVEPFSIELCGKPVIPRSLKHELRHTKSFTVDPESNRAHRVHMTFGLRDMRNMRDKDTSSLCLFWHGRLIRAYEPVKAHLLGLVPGVMGIMELNHLAVHRDKQEFMEELGTCKRAYSNMLQHASRHLFTYASDCMNAQPPLLQREGFTAQLTQAALDDTARVNAELDRMRAVDNDGRDVIYCDACGKFRFVSDELYAEVTGAGEDFRWECSMNPDEAHNTCGAPEEEPRAEDGRVRALEEALPNPPFLRGAEFVGWRTVQVKRARAVGAHTHDTYFYAPGSNVRIRSVKDVQRFLRAKDGGSGGSGGGGGGAPGRADPGAERRSKRKADSGADETAQQKKQQTELAIRIKSDRFGAGAEKRFTQKYEAAQKKIEREKSDLERQRQRLLREKAQYKKQQEAAARRSPRSAKEAAAPPPVISRVCVCQLPESECDLAEMVQCNGCDMFFHRSCLEFSQEAVDDPTFFLECVAHKKEAVDARRRRAALVPAAPAPSVSRDAVSALAHLPGGAGAQPEVASARNKPRGWPSSVMYTSRNVYAAPGCVDEKRRRRMERRTTLHGIEIFELPVNHNVRVACMLSQADGAEPPRGVRATAVHAKGALLGMYTGHVREKTDRDLESRYVMLIPAGFEENERMQRGEEYRSLVVDGKTCGNEMRFVNDYRRIAREPNAEFVVRELRAADGASQELGVAVVALRDIAPGEEVTVFYGDSYQL